MRPAVERNEFLAFEREVHGHDRAFLSRPGGSVTGDASNFGIFEDGHVKIRRLFGLGVEPQEWGDFLLNHILYCSEDCWCWSFSSQARSRLDRKVRSDWISASCRD